MSDKLKIAALSAITSIIVALVSTGAIAATKSSPHPSYDQERSLILYKLSAQQQQLDRIDARTLRIEILLTRGGK